MALDTTEKRRSASGLGGMFGVGVTPNAVRDFEWRQQSGFGYSGIATRFVNDAAEKRRCIAGLSMLAGPGVTANQRKDFEWRQQSGFGYSGIEVIGYMQRSYITADVSIVPALSLIISAQPALSLSATCN